MHNQKSIASNGVRHMPNQAGCLIIFIIVLLEINLVLLAYNLWSAN